MDCDKTEATTSSLWQEIITAKDFEKLKSLLVDAGFEIDQNSFKQECTVLHIAIENDQLEMARQLLDHGADVDAQCSIYTSCLHWHRRDFMRHMRTSLSLAAASNKYEAAKLLLQRGANPNYKPGYSGSPLASAALALHYRMIELLLRHGADPNQHGEGRSITFYHGTVMRTPEIRDLFIAYGANVATRDTSGKNALPHALVHSDLDFVRYLLSQNGISVHQMDNAGTTPLHNIMFARRQDVPTVKARIQLLLDRGADINAISTPNRRRTPLYLAAERGVLEIVEYLLGLGAIIDYRDSISPLFGALFSRQVDTVEYLIDKGAKLDVMNHLQHSLVIVALVCVEIDKYKGPEYRVHSWQIVRLLMEKGLTICDKDCVPLTDKTDRRKLDAYRAEFDAMKMTKVCQAFNLTYFDLLVKRGKELEKSLRNVVAREKLELAEYKNFFPSFADRIEANLIRGFAKIHMLEDVTEILFSILPANLPYEVVRIIASYFNDEELRALLTF